MTDVTTIILGLILVCAGLVTAFGIPFIKSKLNAEQLATLKSIVNIAVFAAEQILGPKMGTDKKAYALDYAKKLLAKLGLTFDEEAIDAAIEAQVKELKLTEAYATGGNNVQSESSC